jgi:5-carboxymethyl-2-hydroxymuconate isomerase
MNEVDNIISEAFKLQGVLSKIDESKTHSGLFDVIGAELRRLRLEYMKFHKQETANKIKDMTIKINNFIDNANKYESEEILSLIEQFSK